MKNLDDEAQFSDYERAKLDKLKVKSLRAGNTKGMISLSIPRLRAVFYFRTREEMESKREKY